MYSVGPKEPWLGGGSRIEILSWEGAIGINLANIGSVHVSVRASGVQPRTQPKAVLGWAKGIGLGSESDSV